ncbi:MAG TPA: MotA/TolQ/ExbB proton channel family protein [bacterium]|nr:MotA/TolQ/ExbB proton channel family protein [bacterium]HOX87650.1 MotA/TolQ/ExbB proton channel family protein [bacterium]HPG44960.1 MotA/TolQ/ExbB proton channel family protein [bacterium]HPM99628.1 MotA/TolQ/ExbB proton channel family protein [bacterium]
MDALAYLTRGGVVMIPLLLCSVLGLAIILEKSINLHRRRILHPELVRLIHSIDSEQDIQMAKSLCKKQPGPFANIILVGLQNRHLDKAEIKELIEDQGRQEIRSLERGLSVLEMIAGVAPLLGLLGTVIGMIKVFTVISAQGTGQASLLAGGISEALITTATGLVIGIPILVAYNFYTHRAEDLVLDIEKHSNAMLQRIRALHATERQDLSATEG